MIGFVVVLLLRSDMLVFPSQGGGGVRVMSAERSLTLLTRPDGVKQFAVCTARRTSGKVSAHRFCIAESNAAWNGLKGSSGGVPDIAKDSGNQEVAVARACTSVIDCNRTKRQLTPAFTQKVEETRHKTCRARRGSAVVAPCGQALFFSSSDPCPLLAVSARSPTLLLRVARFACLSVLQVR